MKDSENLMFRLEIHIFYKVFDVNNIFEVNTSLKERLYNLFIIVD